jgi:hypothetical protein
VTLSRAEWRERLLKRLGDEGVDVELTENQLDHALDSALDLWSRHKPYVRWLPFEVPSGQTTTFDFSTPERTDPRSHPDTAITSVLEVVFADDRLAPAVGPLFGAHLGHTLRYGAQGPRLFFEYQVAERTYDRLTGTRPDWRWEPSGRKLYITAPGRPQRIMALCSRSLRIEEVAFDQHSMFTTAAAAYAKMVLARVQGSGDIPGPTPIPQDTEALRQEAREELAEVTNKLEVALSSYPPPTWIG